jgi:WD40 repeat protein
MSINSAHIELQVLQIHLEVLSSNPDKCILIFTLTLACPVFVIKEHSMGVTSLLSDARNEFRLFSGSYDENLHFWDTR